MTNSLHTNWAIFFPAFENSTDLFQYLDVPLIVGTYLEVFFLLLPWSAEPSQSSVKVLLTIM